MTTSQILLIASLALGMFGAGQVWLVQMSSYKLWAFVGPEQWRAYRDAWWRSIWVVVLLPAALLFIVSALMLWLRPANVPPWAVQTGFALQVALFFGTAIWWGPLMATLLSKDSALAAKRYHLLQITHWLRVAIISAYALISLYMIFMSLGASRSVA